MDPVDSNDVCPSSIGSPQADRLGNRYAGTYVILVPFFLHETRSSIVITRIARRLRKKTGDNRYRARAEDERPKLKRLIYTSCTRPICMLISYVLLGTTT